LKESTGCFLKEFSDCLPRYEAVTQAWVRWPPALKARLAAVESG
jgi:hypothetical protein